MKKTFLGIMAAVIVLSVCATTAFAAGPGCRRYFVDADGNGICDNRSACVYADANGDGICDRCGACAYADANGDGICDRCGTDRLYHRHGMAGAGFGGNFVDADGDGVCDNYASGQCRGTGRGCGGNFVDADGDGVCDNYVSGQGRGGCGIQGGRVSGFRSGRGR